MVPQDLLKGGDSLGSAVAALGEFGSWAPPVMCCVNEVDGGYALAHLV